ncbi:MAG: GNAT family N-acetyltransferase [Richelia sp. RM2_1_2]|nr:GNAT family N-acetyltransferase [Richelia sp. SM1_7_0]NJN07956.1 GNAT family N-acetyltransferase [Richelia sp. RM1_1_1]NJO30521.1 GNAT family N-acetyltransferase [Richelia sp. SL_2_1]NJO61698.1 GNAT family N-acetyltransferase [Richelia sp. RM2_1_2]NJS16389.1 GNAT family N-acetyltransferase [Nostocaceae cyanobacterium CSU_2_110]
MAEIETARLRLRPYTLDDLDRLTVILSNPEVMKYSPRGLIPKGKEKQVTREILEYFIKHWDKYGFGVWAAIEKASGKLIGHCGLNCLSNSPEIELIYRLDQYYWNQGIATEATKACLQYGFESVKLYKIIAIASPKHIASRRVMEKAGLKYEKDAHFYKLDVVYYSISKDEWQPDYF